MKRRRAIETVKKVQGAAHANVEGDEIVDEKVVQ